MKILTMLDALDKSQEINLKQEQGYIGISKLCCVPCQLMLDVINEKNPAGRKKRFTTYGTHGGTYPG